MTETDAQHALDDDGAPPVQTPEESAPDATGVASDDATAEVGDPVAAHLLEPLPAAVEPVDPAVDPFENPETPVVPGTPPTEPLPAENPPELSVPLEPTTAADPEPAPADPQPIPQAPDEPVCPNGHRNNWLEIIVGELQDHFHCRCGARMAVSHEPAHQPTTG